MTYAPARANPSVEEIAGELASLAAEDPYDAPVKALLEPTARQLEYRESPFKAPIQPSTDDVNSLKELLYVRLRRAMEAKVSHCKDNPWHGCGLQMSDVIKAFIFICRHRGGLVFDVRQVESGGGIIQGQAVAPGSLRYSYKEDWPTAAAEAWHAHCRQVFPGVYVGDLAVAKAFVVGCFELYTGQATIRKAVQRKRMADLDAKLDSKMEEVKRKQDEHFSTLMDAFRQRGGPVVPVPMSAMKVIPPPPCTKSKK